MTDLAAQRRGSELDYEHLAEFLTDMAKRDRRDVESRLAVLIALLLKWQYQPDKRFRSWRLTAEQQRQELRRLLACGILRNHAGAVPAEVYADGVKQAAIDTGLPESAFPVECPYSLAQLEQELAGSDLPDE
jgi:Domain of unknown function DUF29